MNKNQEFFIEIMEKFNDTLFKLSTKELKNIYKLQKEQRDELLKEVGEITLNLGVKDEVLNLGNAEKIKLIQEVDKKIKGVVKSEEEIRQVMGILKNIGLDKYYINTYVLSLGLDFNIKKVDEKILESIIDRKIEGVLWSDRIHKNKGLLEQKLKVEIRKFLNGNTSVNSISKNIKDIFNIEAGISHRLVRTETARVLEQVNEEWAKENNIKYQLFSATLDSKTSETCSQFDGKVYEIEDTNKPIPPLHPYCRSTLIAIPNKDWKPKTRLDNENRETVDYTTYKEWKEKNNI